jgi:hypothetical protein
MDLSQLPQIIGRTISESPQCVVLVPSGIGAGGDEETAVHTTRELVGDLCMRSDGRTRSPLRSFLRENLGVLVDLVRDVGGVDTASGAQSGVGSSRRIANEFVLSFVVVRIGTD